MKKRAYISVSNKDNIAELAQELINNNYEIISTGGTFRLLKESGIEVTEISGLTGYPEMLSGKVKSLHPEVFAGILADPTNLSESREIQLNNLKTFDMVVVNLYPFEKIAQETDDIDKLIANIDIGGVSLLRAGAKNYKNVTVVTDIADYKSALNANEATRQTFALKAFARTADYDAFIRSTLGKVFGEKEVKTYNFEKINDLRYGENPHQKAGLYKFNNNSIDMIKEESGKCKVESESPSSPLLLTHSLKQKNNKSVQAGYDILWGKELSYNNILDMTAAVNIASEFYDVPAAAIVKHTAPCGVALGKDVLEAYQKAFDCDPVSAFGGIIAFTQEVNENLAKLLSSVFLEIVIAPDYDEKALDILKEKKNLRIVKLNTSLEDYKKINNEEIKVTPFGVLIQNSDKKELDTTSFKVLTKQKPTAEQIEDAVFAWKVAKHAKSNAIVVAKDFKTLAIGQGQTSRICSIEWALNFACDGTKDAVLASDGFLPAIDNVQAAAQGRIGLIIQPGGSIKDQEVTAEANKYNIAMITTGIRHFRH